MIYFLQLFLAHIIGDFFLQPSSWVTDKETKRIASPYLYAHVLIHFLLIIFITGLVNQENGFDVGGLFKFWLPAAIISILHFAIDCLKLHAQKGTTRRIWFLVDQILHLLVISIVWMMKEKATIDFGFLDDNKILVPLVAVLFLTKPASLIVKTVISKWPPTRSNATGTATTGTTAGAAPQGTATGAASSTATSSTSLENAGELIGVIERLMIITFVLLGKWEGVGFLLAAKSVFRFGDLKDANDMKLTEYVLIGTLLSFGIAILTGIITLSLLGRLN